MLLIDGDASVETKEMIEDYIVEIMSGTPSSQWRVPVIPSGFKKGEGGKINWVSLTGTNKDMEFTGWMDYLNSGVASIFGSTLEDLGIHSQKSQPLWESSREPVIKSTKSLVLGDVLSFLQSYINRIIEKINPDYEIEFVGYEKDDPKEMLDIDKGEVDSWKPLNEKLKEKGFKPIDMTKITNPADLPMNPQVIQAWQAIQGMSGGMEDMEWEGGLSEEDAASGEDNEESLDFGGYGGDFGSGENPKNEPPETKKSLTRRAGTKRIMV
jgi:hypothetical protein